MCLFDILLLSATRLRCVLFGTHLLTENQEQKGGAGLTGGGPPVIDPVET